MPTLAALAWTTWTGTAELWVDPLGDAVTRSACTLTVENDVVRYTWSHAGEAHQGSLTFRDGGADFVDTWHQPQPMRCASVPGAWGLLQVQGEYGHESDWRWRTALCVRAPTGELVLQMTNVAPWGEEARAVRMTCTRQ